MIREAASRFPSKIQKNGVFFCLLAECWHPEQAQGQEEKFSEYVYFSPHDVNLYVASASCITYIVFRLFFPILEAAVYYIYQVKTH